ncbi:MAG: type II secretion system protein [Verrucomicrobia bacterium]|nr:type II secretion system protein [Verrucomicrobiota bacterium]
MKLCPRQFAPRGFILIAVLVLVMLISMIAISLMFQLKAADTAVSAGSGGEQAWSAAMSGVQEAIRVARGAKPGLTDWGGQRGRVQGSTRLR